MTTSSLPMTPGRDNAAGGPIDRRVSAVWPIWRAHRTALLAAATLVGAAAVALVVLRLLVDRRTATATPGQWCPDGGGCQGAVIAEGMRVGDVIPVMIMILLALPMITGAMLGAVAVAREAERGTLALALTQGLTRRRWWLTTFAVACGPMAVAFTGLGLLALWALDPLDNYVGGLLITPYFQTRGPVLGAYFVLAFSAAAAIGVWRHGTVVALVGSLVGCSLLVLFGLGTLRANYAEPTTVTRPLAQSLLVSGERPDVLTWRDWQLEVTYVAADGRTMNDLAISCSGDVPDEPFDTFWERCLEADGYTDEVTVFHSMRQWPRFQAIESAIVLGLAAVAGFLGCWRLGRRPE